MEKKNKEEGPFTLDRREASNGRGCCLKNGQNTRSKRELAGTEGNGKQREVAMGKHGKRDGDRLKDKEGKYVKHRTRMYRRVVDPKHAVLRPRRCLWIWLTGCEPCLRSLSRLHREITIWISLSFDDNKLQIKSHRQRLVALNTTLYKSGQINCKYIFFYRIPNPS